MKVYIDPKRRVDRTSATITVYSQNRVTRTSGLGKTYPIFNSETHRIESLENTIFMSKEFIINCPYCGSTNIESSEKETKCCNCGMGKYTEEKRK